MFWKWKCLQCGNRISPIRYWRTRSEFCRDEHAKAYLDRILECLLEEPVRQERAPVQSLPSWLPAEGAANARQATVIGTARENRSSEEALKAILDRNESKGSANKGNAKKKISRKKQRRRPMTAAQRKAISKRMKAYWAEKKRVQKSGPVPLEIRPSRPAEPMMPQLKRPIPFYTEKAG